MTRKAEHAIATWQMAKRRRSASAALERAMDAAMAIGGVVFANATFSLNLGLPDGKLGMLAGLGILVAGIVMMRRARNHRFTPRPVHAAPQPVWHTSIGHAA